MALVDYKSSDEENSEPEPTTRNSHPPRKKLKPTKARILINLPPASATTTSSQLEPQTQQSSELPSHQDDLLSKLKRKKPGSTASTKTSGLASLLPPPKRTQPQPSSSLSSLAFKPKAVEKKNDQPTEYSLPASAVQPDPISASSSTGTLNLFGLPLSSSSSNPSPSAIRASIENQDPRPTLSVSSAPQVSEELPPPPSLLDPYPGYWQKKDGSWCARESSDPIWKAFFLKHYSSHPSSLEIPQQGSSDNNTLPKDFFKDAPTSLVSFDAKQVAKNAWENKPKIIDPREEARQEQQASAATKPAKHISSRARGRHQLASLLTDAQANRAELEDRISRGKFNRKAGGAKYGF